SVREFDAPSTRLADVAPYYLGQAPAPVGRRPQMRLVEDGEADALSFTGGCARGDGLALSRAALQIQAQASHVDAENLRRARVGRGQELVRQGIHIGVSRVFADTAHLNERGRIAVLAPRSPDRFTARVPAPEPARPGELEDGQSSGEGTLAAALR